MERRVMSLSRRTFSKEFKEAAVKRLELGHPSPRWHERVK
jgi:hypothetical protein